MIINCLIALLLSLLTVNAIAYVDEVFIPVSMEMLARQVLNNSWVSTFG
jgi:cellulose biosynthesis protein BcsQ